MFCMFIDSVWCNSDIVGMNMFKEMITSKASFYTILCAISLNVIVFLIFGFSDVWAISYTIGAFVGICMVTWLSHFLPQVHKKYHITKYKRWGLWGLSLLLICIIGGSLHNVISPDGGNITLYLIGMFIWNLLWGIVLQLISPHAKVYFDTDKVKYTVDE